MIRFIVLVHNYGFWRTVGLLGATLFALFLLPTPSLVNWCNNRWGELTMKGEE